MTETTRTILSALAQADRGEALSLPIAGDLYSEESLRAAIEAYVDHCAVERTAAASGCAATIAILVRPEHRTNSRVIISGFLTFLLSHAAQARFRAQEVR